MLESKENIPRIDDEETVAETGAVENPSKKRGPGRPPGSKNKISANARELLATEGIAGIKALCKFAAGKAVYRPISGGAREKLIPDVNQMIQAQRAILDRLVPSLKAQEISGTDGAALFPAKEPDPVDNRKLARAILATLSEAELADAETTVEQKLDTGAGERPALNGEVVVTGSAASPNQSWTDEISIAPAIGQTIEIGDAGHCISLREISRDGRQRWFIHDENGEHRSAAWGKAEAMRQCEQLATTGRIEK